MGEARRRKLAGNTTPDKQWQGRKAGQKHSRRALQKMTRDLLTNPIPAAIGLMMAARRASRR